MSIRGFFLVFALLAGCSSTPETITLENGATAYPLVCERLDECEQRARQICQRLDYFVYQKTQHLPVEQTDRPLSKRTTASTLGDAVTTGSTKMEDDAKKRPWWMLVVECDPPPDQIQSRVQINENRVKFERNRAEYIAAVCELRDPELRRIEMQIGRRDYGDFSCEEIQQPKGGHQSADY